LNFERRCKKSGIAFYCLKKVHIKTRSQQTCGFPLRIFFPVHLRPSFVASTDDSLRPPVSMCRFCAAVLRRFPAQLRCYPLPCLSATDPGSCPVFLDNSGFQSGLAPFSSSGFSLPTEPGSPFSLSEPGKNIIARAHKLVNSFFNIF